MPTNVIINGKIYQGQVSGLENPHDGKFVVVWAHIGDCWVRAGQWHIESANRIIASGKPFKA
jgi:hypothetical protein